MSVCAVCSLERPLRPATAPQRRLLETIVCPFMTTADLNPSCLLLCKECQTKMLSIHQFQTMALNGIRFLKRLLSTVNVEPVAVQDSDYTGPTLCISGVTSLAHGAIKTEPEMWTSAPTAQSVAPEAGDSDPEAWEMPLKLEQDLDEDHGPEWKPEPQTGARSHVSEEQAQSGGSESPPHCGDTPVGLHTESHSDSFAEKNGMSENIGCAEKDAKKSGDKSATEASLAADGREVDGARTTEDKGTTDKDKPAKKARVRKKPEPATCPHCAKVFRGAACLRMHHHRAHAEVKPVTCDECGRQCRNEEVLKTHKNGHRRKDILRPELFCQECSLQFHSPAQYKIHRLSLKHTPREHYKFECEFCKKKFPSDARLREHVDGQHRGLTAHGCGACGARFTSRARLRTHARAHAAVRARRHVCHVCGKAFTISNSLREHLLAHRGLRPFRCALCPADFSYRAALYTHTRLKHAHGASTEKPEH